MSDLEDRLRAALRDETAELSARSELADDMVSRGMAVRRRRRAAGGIAGLVVLAAAFPLWRSIDTSSGPVGPSTTSTESVVTHAPPTPPSTSTTSITTGTPPAWSTRQQSGPGQPGKQPRVVNLRVGQHDGYDRVVIDFVGPVPEYHIRYVDNLVYDGSGEPVHLTGARYLLILLDNAVAHDALSHSVYLGPDLKQYTMPTLRGTVFTGDFEGVSFGLALSKHAGFQVSTLSSPTRLVIDLQH